MSAQVLFFNVFFKNDPHLNGVENRFCVSEILKNEIKANDFSHLITKLCFHKFFRYFSEYVQKQL